MQFASHYSKKKRVQVTFTGVGRTRQSCREECDINHILKKYNVTEAHLHANRYQGEYGFASSETLHDALNTVTKATSMFEELPANIRAEFDGDPGKFLDFTSDAANLPRMAELGLTRKDYVPEPKIALPADKAPSAPKKEPSEAPKPAPAEKPAK